ELRAKETGEREMAGIVHVQAIEEIGRLELGRTLLVADEILEELPDAVGIVTNFDVRIDADIKGETDAQAVIRAAKTVRDVIAIGPLQVDGCREGEQVLVLAQ